MEPEGIEYTTSNCDQEYSIARGPENPKPSSSDDYSRGYGNSQLEPAPWLTRICIQADEPHIGRHCEDVGPEPSSYRAASEGQTKRKSLKGCAMRHEMEGHLSRETFIASRLRSEQSAVAAKCVYIGRSNHHQGEVVKGKPTLVTQRLKKNEGMDILNTLSPVSPFPHP